MEKFYLVINSKNGKKVNEFQSFKCAYDSMMSDSDVKSFNDSWAIVDNEKNFLNFDLGLSGSFEALEELLEDYLKGKMKIKKRFDQIYYVVQNKITGHFLMRKDASNSAPTTPNIEYAFLFDTLDVAEHYAKNLHNAIIKTARFRIELVHSRKLKP